MEKQQNLYIHEATHTYTFDGAAEHDNAATKANEVCRTKHLLSTNVDACVETKMTYDKTQHKLWTNCADAPIYIDKNRGMHTESHINARDYHACMHHALASNATGPQRPD
jgi:hypothetical protein